MQAIFLDERLTEGVAACLSDLSPYLGRTFERRFKRQQRKASEATNPTD